MNTCDLAEAEALAYEKYKESCLPFNPDDWEQRHVGGYTSGLRWYHKRNNFSLYCESVYITIPDTNEHIFIWWDESTSKCYYRLVSHESTKGDSETCLKITSSLDKLIVTTPFTPTGMGKVAPVPNKWWEFWK